MIQITDNVYEQTSFLDVKLPMVAESEAIIATHAPAARRVLDQLGAGDLAAMLGIETA